MNLRRLLRKPAAAPIEQCKAGHLQPTPIEAQVLDCNPPHTVLLYRCARCHRHWTMTFLGNWIITDFLKTQADIAYLEGLMK